MERARREDDAIRLHRARRLKKIDICPGVPYVYVRSTDVWNGLVYLILSSATRLDAVWRALRPFKEGEKFPSHRLPYVFSGTRKASPLRSGLRQKTDRTQKEGVTRIYSIKT